MVWAALSWFSVGPDNSERYSTAKKYVNTLADQVHPMVQQTLFPSGDGVFQDDSSPFHSLHRPRLVF